MQILNVSFFLLWIANGETGQLSVCFTTESLGKDCTERGTLDLDLKQLSSQVDASTKLFQAMKAHPEASYISAHLSIGNEEFVSAYPLAEIRISRGFVEQILVRMDSQNRVIGMSYGFKQALGAPLFAMALVNVDRPIIAGGPVIVAADIPKQEAEKEEEEEQPSFLRRYWWVIVGVMLFSSAFGPQQQVVTEQPK